MVADVAGKFLTSTEHPTQQGNRRHPKGVTMRGIKVLVSTTALLAGLALAPAARAQLVVEVGIQPICPYGYYGYAPYQCAPMGYYGSGYFYNGIFLGMGPWAGWGYSHGWGGHRFVADGGGRYHGGAGRVAYQRRSGGGQVVRGGGGVPANRGNAHPSGARPSAVRRAPAAHASAPHGAAPHGGAPHGGAQAHGGSDPHK